MSTMARRRALFVAGLLVGCLAASQLTGGFPKVGVPFWGFPIIRTIVYWGLYWGTLILGNCHMPCSRLLRQGFGDNEAVQLALSATGAGTK